MTSDSKVIKWISSVIKFVDSFSIEPDAEFPQRSEYCKSTAGDLYRIDTPLHCSTPIPRTAYCSHPEIMDHKQMDGTENPTSLKTFCTMLENAECNSRELSQNTYLSDTRLMDYSQMDDETQISVPKSSSAMLRNSECCCTPNPGTAYYSHLEIMGHKQMIVIENSTLPKIASTKQENAPCFQERNFVPNCGESFRSETEGTSRTPVFQEPSEHWTNMKIGSQLNLDWCSNMHNQSPKSTKKDIDLFFESFLPVIAQQVAEGMTLSEDAVHVIGILLMNVFDTIVNRAARLSSFRKKKTLMRDDLKMAIELTLPPKMAFMADRNASLKMLMEDS